MAQLTDRGVFTTPGAGDSNGFAQGPGATMGAAKPSGVSLPSRSYVSVFSGAAGMVTEDRVREQPPQV